MSPERFVYRGQVKEWSDPLIPSLFRRSVQLKRIFSPADPEYEYALRRCGRQFIEMKPDSYVEWILLTMKDQRITSQEYQSLMALAANPEFASLIAGAGLDAALERWVRPEHRQYAMARRHLWKTILDATHRAMIRQLGFIQPFGYVLGMTLAQQYGFASELLDFTSDVDVAAFFATHDGPQYLFEGPSLSRMTHSDIGVIYRLPSTARTMRHERIDSHDYYSCPPQVHLSDVCTRFEDMSSPELSEQWTGRLEPEEMVGLVNAAIPLRFLSAMVTEDELTRAGLSPTGGIDRYLTLYYEHGTGNVRYYRLLNQPPGSFAQSRLGRQSAVGIVPDELRVATKEPGQFEYATFQAIEDVSQREGFERFYFRHTARPPGAGALIREWLWPRDGDCFRIMISRVLEPSTEQYWFGDHPVPKRLDLVSAGYGDA
jgi:hypothetical protein